MTFLTTFVQSNDFYLSYDIYSIHQVFSGSQLTTAFFFFQKPRLNKLNTALKMWNADELINLIQCNYKC